MSAHNWSGSTFAYCYIPPRMSTFTLKQNLVCFSKMQPFGSQSALRCGPGLGRPCLMHVVSGDCILWTLSVREPVARTVCVCARRPVCVRASVRACMHAGVYASVPANVRVCMRGCVRACSSQSMLSSWLGCVHCFGVGRLRDHVPATG